MPSNKHLNWWQIALQALALAISVAALVVALL